MILTAAGLTAFIVIPAICRIAQLLKRSEEWQPENGHDRAEHPEYEWYWNRRHEKRG